MAGIANPGLKSLGKIQIGKEATCGVAVPTTTTWLGTGFAIHDNPVTFPEIDVGTLFGITHAVIERTIGTLGLDEIDLTFEQVNLILNACINGVTAVQDGAGSGQIRAYPFPVGGVWTPFTYTIQAAGDQIQAEEMVFAFCTSFNIKGDSEGTLKMSAEFMGQKWENGTFTGAVAIPSVEVANFGNTKLYIDDVNGTIGTTQILDSFVGFDLAVVLNKAQFTGEGNGDIFTYPKRDVPDVQLTFTLEAMTQSYAERDKKPLFIPRAIRIINEGSALTPGTTYNNKTLIIDTIGLYTDVVLGSDNNNTQLVFTQAIKDDGTYGNPGQILTVNEVVSAEQP